MKGVSNRSKPYENPNIEIIQNIIRPPLQSLVQINSQSKLIANQNCILISSSTTVVKKISCFTAYMKDTN